MRKPILIFSLIFCFITAKGQTNTSSIFFGSGYYGMKLTEVNNLLTSRTNNKRTAIPFNKRNGLTNLNIGTIITQKKMPKISFEISFDYQTQHQNQYLNPSYESHNSDSSYIPLFSPGIYSHGVYGVLPAGFQYNYWIHSFVVKFTPRYQIYANSSILIDYGLGINYNYLILNQTGVKFIEEIWSSQRTGIEDVSSGENISWHTNINIDYKITSKLYIGLQAEYINNKFENIGSADNLLMNEFLEYDKWYSTFPISKTTFDLSGLGFKVRFVYHFKAISAND